MKKLGVVATDVRKRSHERRFEGSLGKMLSSVTCVAEPPQQTPSFHQLLSGYSVRSIKYPNNRWVGNSSTRGRDHRGGEHTLRQ